jgi:hypothetical protein
MTIDRERELLLDHVDEMAFSGRTAAKAILAKLDRLTEETNQAKEYATRLFSTVAPQCKPMADAVGLLSQLDNYIAGQKRELDRREAVIREVRLKLWYALWADTDETRAAYDAETERIIKGE